MHFNTFLEEASRFDKELAKMSPEKQIEVLKELNKRNLKSVAKRYGNLDDFKKVARNYRDLQDQIFLNDAFKDSGILAQGGYRLAKDIRNTSRRVNKEIDRELNKLNVPYDSEENIKRRKKAFENRNSPEGGIVKEYFYPTDLKYLAKNRYIFDGLISLPNAMNSEAGSRKAFVYLNDKARQDLLDSLKLKKEFKKNFRSNKKSSENKINKEIEIDFDPRIETTPFPLVPILGTSLAASALYQLDQALPNHPILTNVGSWMGDLINKITGYIPEDFNFNL